MNWWRRLREMPNEAPAKTLLVALSVSLVCALFVSTSAVVLQPRQEAARREDQKRQISKIVTGLPATTQKLIEAAGEVQIEARVVELATGAFADDIDPAKYDQRKAAADPNQSVEIPQDDDVARIQRRARYAVVYLVRSDRGLELIILPVHGKGYASTMYGFLALAGDGNTVAALNFYEHGETPGFGAGITDPAWQELWRDKKLRDRPGKLRIGVARGPAAPDAAAHEVDGLSGATRTGRGVTALLHFWLGEWGFGPFLERITAP
jgi:Na+-transporting NADH:ubiquinone oxidoreductase subunit C